MLVIVKRVKLRPKVKILRAAFAPIFLRQKVQTLNLSTKKLHAKLLYEKAVRIMLMKLRPEVTIAQTNCDAGKADEESINQENDVFVPFTQPEGINNNL